MSALHLYQILILTGLGAVFLSTLVNLLAFGTMRRATGKTSPTPRISVLVPARDEERSIGECLASLQGQDYPDFEVILLDDESTDRTAAIAESLGFQERDSQFRLIRGTTLPPGWVGKNWACHQLSQAATGECLLFTDADTRHDAGTLAAAIEHSRATGASLLSAWPRLLTGTWSEKLIIPMLHLLAFSFYPHALFNLIQKYPAIARLVGPQWMRNLGAANGQFMFFNANDYRKLGGHESVRADVVEDVALGREVAARVGDGMRLVNCDGAPLVDCRMYRSFAEVWDGFTKNLRAAFGTRLSGFVGMGIVQVCLFLLPFAFLLFSGEWMPLVLAQIAAIYAMRTILAFRFGTSALGVVLHPIGIALAMLIALNSWRRTVGDGVVWKGRKYLGRSGK